MRTILLAAMAAAMLAAPVRAQEAPAAEPKYLLTLSPNTKAIGVLVGLFGPAPAKGTARLLAVRDDGTTETQPLVFGDDGKAPVSLYVGMLRGGAVRLILEIDDEGKRDRVHFDGLVMLDALSLIKPEELGSALDDALGEGTADKVRDAVMNGLEASMKALAREGSLLEQGATAIKDRPKVEAAAEAKEGAVEAAPLKIAPVLKQKP